MKIKHFLIILFFLSFKAQSQTVITFDSPVENKNFNKGDTVWLIATVKSSSALHEVNAAVCLNNDSTMILQSKNYHTHGSVQAIKMFFIVPTIEPTIYRFVVKTMDHGYNISAEQQRVFKTNSVEVKPTNKPSKKKSKKKK